jgi:hypothetical protein
MFILNFISNFNQIIKALLQIYLFKNESINIIYYPLKL